MRWETNQAIQYLEWKKKIKIGQYYTEKKMDQTDVTDYLPETFRIDLSMY